MRALRRVERQPFEAAFALVGVLIGVGYALDPATAQRAAVGHTDLLAYWTALYALGGAVILVGLSADSLRTEVAGLVMFGAAVTIQSVATIHFYGVTGYIGVITTLAVVVACLLRIRFLLGAYLGAHRNGAGGAR